MHFLVFFETPSSTHLSPLLLCCLLPYSQGLSPHSITIVLINSSPSLAAIDSTHQHHLPCSLFDHHLLFIPPCRASSSICPCCFPFLLAAAVAVLHHHHQHLHVLFLLMLTYCYSFSLQSVMVAAPLFCSTRCCCCCVNLSREDCCTMFPLLCFGHRCAASFFILVDRNHSNTTICSVSAHPCCCSCLSSPLLRPVVVAATFKLPLPLLSPSPSSSYINSSLYLVVPMELRLLLLRLSLLQLSFLC